CAAAAGPAAPHGHEGTACPGYASGPAPVAGPARTDGTALPGRRLLLRSPCPALLPGTAHTGSIGRGNPLLPRPAGRDPAQQDRHRAALVPLVVLWTTPWRLHGPVAQSPHL